MGNNCHCASPVPEQAPSATLVPQQQVAAQEAEPVGIDFNSPAVDPSAPLNERDIVLVQHTWELAAKLGVETVGKVVFMQIFKIAPGALALFPFSDVLLDELYTSSRLLDHASKVVNTVGTAVSLLRDLGTLVPVLQELGTKHVAYGVLPVHYDVVAEAVIYTLAMALGAKCTEAVKNSWTKVLTTVKTVMAGTNYDSP